MTCCVDAAMECLANITEALGEAVSPHITKLLEPLFKNGISKQVRGFRLFRLILYRGLFIEALVFITLAYTYTYRVRGHVMLRHTVVLSGCIVVRQS